MELVRMFLWATIVGQIAIFVSKLILLSSANYPRIVKWQKYEDAIGAALSILVAIVAYWMITLCH